MKLIREQVKFIRSQVVDKIIAVLEKNDNDINMWGEVYTPSIDTKVGELCTIDRITYMGKGEDSILIDMSNEEYNCTLALEELELDYLLDIAEYLEENVVFN